MIEETTRPFTAAEQRLLRIRVATALPKIGSVYWMRDERRAALITLAVSAALILLGASFKHPVLGVVLSAGFMLVRAIGYRERRRLRRHMQALGQKWAEELQAGQARAITCKPTRIIEHEEYEDEGAFWIFDGGDGRYLVITGQDYYDTPRFPSAHFEVVMGARHQVVIGIRSHGPRMPSTFVVESDAVTWDYFPDEPILLFNAPPHAELKVIQQHLAEATKKTQ